MRKLEERIRKDGKVLPGGILKVDSFLNHCIDPQLYFEMAQEFARLYEGAGINKIITIEASGIALACMTGYVFGCPMVFAKKSKSRNIADDVWSVPVESFTHGNINNVVISKEYLGPEDRVLIVDDFLATGAALRGLKELVEMAGGTIVGAGIIIEKLFQGGGNSLRDAGMRIESLARITGMTDDSITFEDDEI